MLTFLPVSRILFFSNAFCLESNLLFAVRDAVCVEQLINGHFRLRAQPRG